MTYIRSELYYISTKLFLMLLIMLLIFYKILITLMCAVICTATVTVTSTHGGLGRSISHKIKMGVAAIPIGSKL